MKAGVPVSKGKKDTQVRGARAACLPSVLAALSLSGMLVLFLGCNAKLRLNNLFFCPMFVFLVIRSVDCSPGKGRARKTQVVQLIATSAKKSGRLCMRSAQSQWMSTRLYKYVCKSGGEYSFFFLFVLPNFPKKYFKKGDGADGNMGSSSFDPKYEKSEKVNHGIFSSEQTGGKQMDGRWVFRKAIRASA